MNNPRSASDIHTSNDGDATHASPEEALLAELIAALESAPPGEGEAVIARYVAQHPHLADRIRRLLEMRTALHVSHAESPSDLPQRLGEFRIVRVLSAGGMGVICEAIEERLQRRVAIKMIRRGRVLPEARDRFLREQAVLAQMHQTNIVAVFAAGEQDSVQYFVMPLIRGASLSQVVAMASRRASNSATSTPGLAKLAQSLAEGETLPALKAGGLEATTVAAAGGVGRQRLAVDTTARRPVRLSETYFRSVAEAMATAARAIHYAHTRNILHRDVKPSNLMIEPSGQCWVIDFGLAGYLNEQGDSVPERSNAPVSLLGTSSGVLGTPQYMAPEQFQARADARTDVWGLGVTLYELLALRPPFADPGHGREVESIRDRIVRLKPPPLRRFTRNAPADLAAICQKAMEKAPERRYQTAESFADDLQRWLKAEPPVARRPLWRQAWLSCKRHRGWATAIAAGWAILLGVAFWSQRQATFLEASRADAEVVRSSRLARREVGWFHDGLAVKVAAAAGERDIRRDQPFKSELVAALAEMDGRAIARLPRNSSSVAFSPDGRLLLFGGFSDGKVPAAAGLWTIDHRQPRCSELFLDGPVAFSAAGTPMQAAVDPQDRFQVQLWRVDKQSVLSSFRLTDETAAEKLDARRPTVIALSANGRFVAASAALSPGVATTVAWETATGRQVLRQPWRANHIRFSNDGAVIAVACEPDQQVRVLGIPGGELLCEIDCRHAPVQAIALGKNPRIAAAGRGEHANWLLAIGDAVGKASVWDLDELRIKCIARGSRHGFASLAFSSDCTLLATAGRERCNLYDAATGEFVLSLGRQNAMSDVAFSKNDRVAISSTIGFSPSELVVWELDRRRGIDALRGLAGSIEKVVFSPDQRFVAAVSHEWQAAIWDLSDGRLVQVVRTPIGDFVDSAALAFNHTSDRLAFSAGASAVLWTIGQGQTHQLADLPSGLNDVLAFSPDGQRLVSARMECLDKREKPFGPGVADRPRVMRLRNLLAEQPTSEIAEIAIPRGSTVPRAISPDGRFVLSVQRSKTDAKTSLLAIDGASGEAAWRLPLPYSETDPEVHTDPSGQQFFLGAMGPAGRRVSHNVIAVKTGRILASLPPQTVWLGLRNEFRLVETTEDQTRKWNLYRGDEADPLFTLNLDGRASSNPVFSPRGDLVSWGEADGTVRVCHLALVNRRLAELGDRR